MMRCCHHRLLMLVALFRNELDIGGLEPRVRALHFAIFADSEITTNDLGSFRLAALESETLVF